MTALRGSSGGRLALAVTAACVAVAGIGAQSLIVSAAGGALRVQAPAFRLIDGAVFDRLRDGQAVQLAVSLTASERAGGPAVAAIRQSFSLSFDLWEERIAVTRAGTPPRSISHLRPRDAEAWCLDQLALPVADLVARRGRDGAFWIKVEYQVQDPEADPGGDEAFSLRTLIDALSRRRQESQRGQSVEAGPFRMSGLSP